MNTRRLTAAVVILGALLGLAAFTAGAAQAQPEETRTHAIGIDLGGGITF